MEAIDGVDAVATVLDILPKTSEEHFVTVAQQPLRFGATAIVNGKLSTPDRQIHDGDEIEEKNITTIAELFAENGMDIYQYEPQINGNILDFDYILNDNDEIELGVGEVLASAESQDAQTDETNIADVNAKDEQQPQQAGIIYVMINDRRVELPAKQDKSPYLFVDMLNYIDIDPTTPKSNIKILKNGVDASYLDVVTIGDSIDVSWEDS